ncbi:hypothetical protein IAR50_005068 [Cryptococcus sp. DSM 104548]
MKPPQPLRRLNDLKSSRSIVGIFGILALVISWAAFSVYREDVRVSGSWGCEMSWMSPSYVPLHWPKLRTPQRYGLYRYLEQRIDTDSPPGGHPVIFVPGNAGSYQQVRSIASAAARQYQHPSTARQSMPTRIDFYTVDFNEEFSAFDAQSLREQSEFIQTSIKRVLAEYGHLPERTTPTQVTFVSHSMGGIATLLALDSHWAPMVDAVITLSTPHMAPPVTIEYDMDAIYSIIYQQSHAEAFPPIVSVCGGISDTQIVSESCVLPIKPGSEDRQLTAFTTGVPMAWTGVDHQAMVWCHQIRWGVADLLLDWTNSNGRDKINMARQRLVGPLAPSPSPSLSGVVIARYPISTATSQTMTILRRRTESVTLQECDEEGKCYPVDSQFSLLPFPQNTSAPFPSPGEGVGSGDAILSGDINITLSKGTLEVSSLPGEKDWVVFGRHIHRSVRGNSWERDEDDENVAHYTLRFTEPLSSSLLTYDLEAVIGSCEGGQYPLIKHTSIPVTPLHNSVSEARFYPITSLSSVHRLHAHVSLGPFLSTESVKGVNIEVFQSPACPIQRIKLSPWYIGTLGKLVTRYRMVALAWPVGWASAVVLRQVIAFHVTGSVPAYNKASMEVAVYWLPKSLVGIVFMGFLQTALPGNGWTHSLILGNTDLAFLPLLVIFSVWSFGITCLVWSGVLITISVYRKMLSSPVLRWTSGVGATRIKQSVGWEGTHQRPSTGRSNATVLGAIALIAIVSAFLPHEIVHVAACMILWTMVANENSSSHTEPSSLTALSGVLVLLAVMLPFKVPHLLVWSRNLYNHRQRQVSVMENLCYAGPPISVVLMFLQGATYHKRPNLLLVCKASLLLLSFSVAVAGGRWTWIIPPLTNLSLCTLVGLLW